MFIVIISRVFRGSIRSISQWLCSLFPFSLTLDAVSKQRGIYQNSKRAETKKYRNAQQSR